MPLNGPVGFDGGLVKKRRSIDAERAVMGKKKAPDETATPDLRRIIDLSADSIRRLSG